MIELVTLDGERFWVGLSHITAMKQHPERKPVCGLLFLSSGKELFINLDSYQRVLNHVKETDKANTETKTSLSEST